MWKKARPEEGQPETKLCTNFKKERQKIPIFFFRHITQNAINLGEENGPDIEYSEYKIRRLLRRVEIKFLKYGGLHPMDLGQEGDRDEEVWEDGGLIFG